MLLTGPIKLCTFASQGLPIYSSIRLKFVSLNIRTFVPTPIYSDDARKTYLLTLDNDDFVNRYRKSVEYILPCGYLFVSIFYTQFRSRLVSFHLLLSVNTKWSVWRQWTSAAAITTDSMIQHTHWNNRQPRESFINFTISRWNKSKAVDVMDSRMCWLCSLSSNRRR